MSAQNILIVTILGYLLGCIQAAYLIGMLIKKKDIRKYGSFNAGASNATIVWGWKYGIAVALIDILKAVAGVMLIRYFFSDNIGLRILMYLVGACVILGHNYPFYMKFKGGKGTASLIGMLLAIDWRIALICILLIAVITIATNYIAIGTIAMVTSFSILTAVFNFGTIAIIISAVLSLLSIYNHLPNIRRIMNRQETGLRSTMRR